MTSTGPEPSLPDKESSSNGSAAGKFTKPPAANSTFVRGSDRLNQLLARPGMAEAVAAIHAELFVDPADILTDDMRARMQVVFEAWGATDVAIFGSVANGTSRPGSDIDLIAKFPPDFTLFNLIDLTEALEALLTLPVDLVSDDPRAGAAVEHMRSNSVPLVRSSE